MVQKLGENIKRLRLECGMTQERLAEYLGVSSVAVSKWESSATCPDISMLIPLSELFGVTTDELLGAVPEKREARCREVTDEVRRAWQNGTYDEYVSTARRAVAEFPASEELRYHLFTALMRRTSVSGAPCADKRELMLEAERIAKTLLDETKNDAIRVGILPKLVFLYRNGFFDEDQAMRVAESIAPISHSREITKYYAIDCGFGRDAVDALSRTLNDVICIYAQTRPLIEYDEAIAMIRTAERIVELIYGGDSGFRDEAIEHDEYAAAQILYALGRNDEALDAIETACAHAEAFDDWNRFKYPYESVLVRGLYYGGGKDDIIGDSKCEYSHCEYLLTNKLADGFDAIRETPRFRAVMDKLTERTANARQQPPC